ncbi:cobalt transporter CbiM [Apilactobacillus micheneri]|uniref:Cobalt transporter CbiM n=1 Tax=Apilactobacillus micheneri TaxID=1899430 RepID=A0ABY2Z3U6_9LACO|nr:cobalt transporter CbiM [Apilactobacillus micheneri]TPR26367.1 cobalt transporter CbiM [Apilactobacillus micheneri]TPR27121.1 cobalt transporter CbiM [Apilactobacillus micheneri]TPR27369.1 cobalt transporter CbiM [Apilactobacillus micheneri]TPR31884.1 cobalt transporter CbiM [Apilactobacillus micheneri]TPR32288.1 cobalt transporter CbiM [Apilactobacillus micheneri]
MHIPDNYLSPVTCGTLFAAVTPIWTIAVIKVKKQIKKHHETLPMIGIASSLAFLIMMFNLPIPGGTTAHAVGGTLLSILIGPWATCLAITVTLLLQAFLFGDGGILSFGVNVMNMAVIMPFVGYWIYKIGKKFKHEKLGVILGSYIGINSAALLAGIELGIQPLIAHTNNGSPLYCPYGLNITVPAMLLAHLLVAGWVEVIFTLLVFKFVNKVSPTKIYDNSNNANNIHWIYLLIGLALISPLGLIAKNTAFGEWNNQELQHMLIKQHLGSQVPEGMLNGFHFKALFSDYTINGLPISIGYILSAITAILVFLLLVRGLKHETK